MTDGKREPCSDHDAHALRMVIAGSTRAARRAGTQQAASPMAPMVTATTANVAGSCGSTPYSRPCRSRTPNQAPGRHALLPDLRDGAHILDGRRGRDAAHDAGDGGEERFHVAFRPDGQASAEGELLVERHERGRAGRRVEPGVAGVPDHAHDRAPVAGERREPEDVAGPGDAAAERILAGEQSVGERLVHDHHKGGAPPVGARELAPGEERDAGGPARPGVLPA